MMPKFPAPVRVAGSGRKLEANPIGSYSVIGNK